ncbi:neutral zinc metallopeptidase, partial [Planctomycetota bacterium]
METIVRWKGRSRSENIEDRRGQKAMVVGGGGIGIMIIAAIAMFLGADPKPLLDAVAQQQQQQQQQNQAPAGKPAPDDEVREFISVVLHDTETVWERQFATHANQPYRAPKLIIFSDS